MVVYVGENSRGKVQNVVTDSSDEIQAIKLALKNKHQLEQLGNIDQDIDVKQGLSVGAVTTLWQLAQRIGLVQALGSSQDAKRALRQVFARVIDQGSRLSAVRSATTHAACDVLGLDELKTLCTTQVIVKGKPLLHNVPQPRESVAQLLRAAQVELPRKIASRGVQVSTRKKLVEERKTA